MAGSTKVGGITIEIGGDSTKLTDSLKAIQASLSKTGAALKEVTNVLNKEPDSIKQIQDREALLNKELEETKTKLGLLNAAYEKMSEQDGFDEMSKDAIAVRTEIKKTEQQIAMVEGTLSSLKDEEQKLRNQLKKNLETTRSELKSTDQTIAEINKLLKETPDNVVLIADKTTLLDTKIDELQEELGYLNQQYADLAKTDGFDENSKDAIELRTEMANVAQEIKNCEDELDKLGTHSDPLKSLFNDAASVGKEMQDIGKEIEKVGAKLSIVSAAVTKLGKESVSEYSDFEYQISRVAAAMGITADQIPEIEEKARELGKTTVFTAEEAAEGFVILAQAGYDAKKQIEVLPNVLNLAAAGGLSLDEAAKYLTGTLNGFSNSVKVVEDDSGELTTIVTGSASAFIDAGEATEKYADLLAKGATLAKTTVGELGEAMSVSASIASGAYHQSAEDVTVALLRLADQNVTATTAGTALNRVMQDLYAPTASAKAAMEEYGISAYDAEGNTRSINDVLADLGKLFSGMSDEEKAATENLIFTTRGMKAYNQMAATSSSKTKEFYNSLSGISGSAGQQAATMLDNLQGRMTILKSAASDAMIEIGEALAPTIDDFINLIQDGLKWFDRLDDETKTTIANIGLLVAAAGPLTIAIGAVVSGLGAILAHPVISTIALVTAGTIALVAAIDSCIVSESERLDLIRDELSLMEEQAGANKRSLDSYETRIESSKAASAEALNEANSAEALVAKLKEITDENGNVKESDYALAQYILGELSRAYGINADLVDGQITNYETLISTIDDLILKKKAESIASAYQGAYTEALSNQLDVIQRLTEAEDSYSKAIENQQITQENLAKTEEKISELRAKVEEYYSSGEAAKNNNRPTQEINEYLNQISALETEYSYLTKALNLYNDEVSTTESGLAAVRKEYELSQGTIHNYEELTSAIATGSMKELEDASLRLAFGLETAEHSTRESLARQYMNYIEYYKRAKQASIDGTAQISEETLKELSRMVELSKAELESYNAYNSGKNVASGFAKGIADNSYMAINSAGDMAYEAMRRIKNVAEIKSPSHVTQYFGEMIDKGLEKGILDYGTLPADAAESVTEDTLSAFGGSGILSSGSSVGSYSSNSTTNNLGGMVFNIYSQPGQNVEELARMVSEEVASNIKSQKAVFA